MVANWPFIAAFIANTHNLAIPFEKTVERGLDLLEENNGTLSVE